MITYTLYSKLLGVFISFFFWTSSSGEHKNINFKMYVVSSVSSLQQMLNTETDFGKDHAPARKCSNIGSTY